MPPTKRWPLVSLSVPPKRTAVWLRPHPYPLSAIVVVPTDPHFHCWCHDMNTPTLASLFGCPGERVHFRNVGGSANVSWYCIASRNYMISNLTLRTPEYMSWSNTQPTRAVLNCRELSLLATRAIKSSYNYTLDNAPLQLGLNSHCSYISWGCPFFSLPWWESHCDIGP